jgi:O-antigen/teichoic acid export membrane protein
MVGEVPRIQISISVLWTVLKIGFPIMLIGVAALALGSVDRIVIAARLPHEALGFFGLAAIISRFISGALTDAMRVVLFPRVMEEAGKGETGRLEEYFIQPTLLIAYFLPFLIGAAYLTIHLPLEYFLPDYLPAEIVCKILIIGSFFGCVSAAAGLVFIAFEKQVQMLIFMLIFAPFKAVLSYVPIALGFGIDGVAVGAVVATCLFGGVIIGYAMSLLRIGIREGSRLFIMMYAPFVYALGLLVVIDNVSLMATDSVGTDIAVTVLKLLLFWLAFSLILLPAHKKHPTFALLYNDLATLWTDARKPKRVYVQPDLGESLDD